MAGPAVCRQAPEVGAGWFSDHVRICAGGAQQCAFLPQLGEGLGNDPSYPANESINSKLRDEILNTEILSTLKEATEGGH